MENEKRLIDANALDEQLYEAMRKYDAYDSCQAKTVGGIMEAQDLLYDAPTVDAEVVKHGQWVKYNFLGYDQFACSECQTLGSPQWKRCPVCEAKMDGDGNG